MDKQSAKAKYKPKIEKKDGVWHISADIPEGETVSQARAKLADSKEWEKLNTAEKLDLLRVVLLTAQD